MRSNKPISPQQNDFPHRKENLKTQQKGHNDQNKEKETDASENKLDYSSFLSDWDGYDAFCLFILIFFGIFSRFWIIQYPRHFTEDEEIQTQYINCYLNHSFFISSQPPLAAMCLAGIAKHSYYTQSYKPPYYEENFTFPNMEYVALRSPSAFCSAIVIPLSFFIVRLLGASTFGAFGAGVFTLVDFLLIGASRNITTDGFIQLFVALTMFFTALMTKMKQNTIAFCVCLIIQSILCGCCISSSWSCTTVVLFIMIFNVTTMKSLKTVPVTIISAILILLLSFGIHSVILPYKTGNEKILSQSYQNDLIEPGQQINIFHLKIIPHTLELMKKSIKLHTIKGKKEPFFEWPLMACQWKVLWTQLGRTVAIFGNVPIWWGISFGLLCTIIQMMITKKMTDYTTLLFAAFFETMAYFMLGLSERGLRDFQVSLLFGIWGFALFIDVQLPEYISGFVLAAITAISVFIFILWAPLVYGYENFDSRFLPYFAHPFIN